MGRGHLSLRSARRRDGRFRVGQWCDLLLYLAAADRRVCRAPARQDCGPRRGGISHNIGERMMRRQRGLLSMSLAALLALGGAAHAADHLRVGTPEGSAYVFAPIDVGNGAGIFAKAGLEVEKLNFGGGAKLEQAMSAGAIDMTVAGNIGLAYAIKGVPEKAVAVLA